MAYPTHPNNILIKNEYYPTGLTELQVWKYYDKNKILILRELGNSHVLLFLYPSLNKFVVKRNIDNKPIILTSSNFDKYVTPITLSISVERQSMINYYCVDVDAGESVSEFEKKEAVNELLQSSLSNISLYHRITNSSSGYHVYFYTTTYMSIDAAHKILKNILINEFSDKYVVSGIPPKSNEIKFDIVPTTNRGSHTVPYALCRNGLICMDVTKTFSKFNRREAIIK